MSCSAPTSKQKEATVTAADRKYRDWLKHEAEKGPETRWSRTFAFGPSMAITNIVKGASLWPAKTKRKQATA